RNLVPLGRRCKEVLLRDPNLWKEMPANAIDLRHREQAIEAYAEHVPKALLKRLRIHALGHLVLAYDEAFGHDFTEIGAVKLLSRDFRQYDAKSVRKCEFALILVTGRRAQLRISLKYLFDSNCVLPGL